MVVGGGAFAVGFYSMKFIGLGWCELFLLEGVLVFFGTGNIGLFLGRLELAGGGW